MVSTVVMGLPIPGTLKAQFRTQLGENAANDRAPANDRTAATDRAATDRAATDRAPALGGVPANDRPTLASELAARGLAPGDVTDVVLTHLHFDHAGGVTRPDGTLAFPRARHHLQRRNWEWAQHPTERDRGSYRVESFAALSGSDRLELIDGEREILPGLRVLPTDGHTPGLQCVRLEGGGRSLLYPADLIPTAAHLKSSWAMSYDLAPLAVLREKRALLEWAARDGSVVVFEHDPRLAACTVRAEKREFVVDREIQL